MTAPRNSSEPSASAVLTAVLQNQKQLAAALASASQLRTLIAEQQAKASALGVQAGELKALETEREDLLADIATGQDRTQDLAALDARIAQQREHHAGEGTQSAVEQTVAGLTRKLERTEAEMATLQQQRPPLLRGLLMSRAEALGAEYKATGMELCDMYDRLSIYCRLLSGSGHNNIGPAGSLLVPAFPMQSAQASAGALNRNYIVDTTHGGRDALNATLAQEKAALRAIGVEID